MSRFPRIPVLGFDPPLSDDKRTNVHRLIVGMNELTFDGEPFPWETVDDWTLVFSNDSLATLTLSIPVTLPKGRKPKGLLDRIFRR